ncbi:efflux transporter outer membrane subunit [Altererythrobacter xixiisoli]|uniref:Efflux transporter outer membrane subunit n=2 Tax=Croceibacterium xixiisoli TaxID=1476466 RepID=A0A6I4TTU1_9SPHN|nr:efflux transporter outer membrane subunit [Croceibacterium xixiisoli]
MMALAAVSAWAILLSSCATLPEASALPSMAQADSHAAAQSFAATETPWPSDGWWSAFGDPQLTGLIEEGLAGASDLRVAEARLARAQALITQSRSGLLPSVSAGAQAGVTQQSENYLVPAGFAPRGWPDYGQVSANLSWDLDFWGKNRAALNAAKLEASAAQAEAAAARLTIAAGIADGYAGLSGLYFERDAAEKAVTVRSRTVELLAEREREGLENSGAVAQARSVLATAQGQLLALNENIELSQNGLAALMGAGPDRGRSIARPGNALTRDFGLPANIPAELLGRRPDIIAARMRAEAASSRIDQAEAAFYPNINLTALIGLQGLGLGNVFKSGSDFGSAAPALTLPIFDGGRLRGQYRAAEADYFAAVGQYDGVLVQALRQVADAATSRRALDQRLEKAQAAADAAQAAWTVANNRYRGGLASYLNVLTAEDALIAARRDVASLQTRAFSLEIALIRALGGGYRS